MPGSDEAWCLWLEAKRWLVDPSLYEGAGSHIPAEHLPISALSDAHIELMLQAGTVREVSADELAVWLSDGRGVAGVICFGRPEHIGTEKERLRPIRWPKAVNEEVGRDLLFAPPPPLRDDVRAESLGASWGVALDGQAYFDQFRLAPEIQRYYLFRGESDTMFAATTLAMGFRLASDVGTAFMRLLSDPPMIFGDSDFVDSSGVRDANADNVRIMHGQRELAIDATAKFIERCAIAGCRLNEVDVTLGIPREDVAKLVTQSIDFFGEIVDLAAKTTRARQKHQSKAQALIAIFDDVEASPPTWRLVMGAVALGLWAAPIFRIELSGLAGLFVSLQEFGRRASLDQTLWDAPAVVEGALAAACRRLLDALAVNAPTPIDTRLWRHSTAFQTVIVDASAKGWGAISVRPQAGTYRTYSGLWPEDVQHSAIAEPAGIAAAVSACVSPAAQGAVRILTDHKAFPAALRRQRSFAEHLNEVIARLRTGYRVDFRVEYIAGATNPADGLSRGRPVTRSDIETAFQLALT